MAGNQRRVIFIGGSSYSGSTLLDMILSHDPRGFSCGELSALMRPYRRAQLAPDCGCGSPDCTLWTEVRDGAQQPHLALFERHPQVRYLVDSSKYPTWIHEQSRALRREGIGTRNVLIWKTPDEFFASRAKRGRESGWARSWINYHRYYFTMVQDWVSVRYADLVSDPTTLERLCERLELDYFDGKLEYWRQRHHTVFGNSSAKIHLHDTASDGYRRYAAELGDRVPRDGYRTVHHTTAHAGVQLSDRLESQIGRILQVLEHTDVHAPEADAGTVRASLAGVQASPLLLKYQRWKRALQGRLVQFRAATGGAA